MIKLSIFFVLLFYSFALLGQPKGGINYLAILKRASTYNNNINEQHIRFTYQSSNDSVLVALREKFNLDSVAGFGNETSRLINLLHWVHNTVNHDGQHESGIIKINANEIITFAKTKHIGVCCGELATTLNDCYLAMGWKSRKIYCFSKDSLKVDHDSHVINAVYLNLKNKWIWMDPTNDAYVMNEKGELLSIDEVRERLILDKPLIVNPDANWNRKSSVIKENYLDTYMAKNLYRFYSPLASQYDYETWGQNNKVVYVYLYPLDYTKKINFKTDDYYNTDLKTTFSTLNIYDKDVFWQSPSNE